MDLLLKAIFGIFLAAVAALESIAADQTFPNRPIRLITGPAGSENDIVARMLGAKLGEALGQPVVVENRAGAGGAVAAATVAKAAPDGHTLLSQSAQFAIRAALHTSLPYDPLNDFAGVTRIGFSTQVLVVAPSLSVKSVRDFIAYAQARPGAVLFSSGGAGTGMHMDGERFRLAADIMVKHVGFKGASEALIEVLAGRVQYAVPGLGPALPLIKDGRLVALAVVTPQRSPLLPEVPAMAEVLPGYERDGSYGLFAPVRTPRVIVDRVNKEVRRILEQPDTRERLQAVGLVPSPSTPEEHDRILRADIESYSKIVRLVGLRGP